jgi:SAM-dependent methyltransferase
MLKDSQDAFGHAVHDYFEEGLQMRRPFETIEREDGFVDTDRLDGYFREFREWLPAERHAMRFARGRVLDIGSGAGRHALYLQGRGLDVLAVDNSPLALEVCRRRGVRNTALRSISGLDSSLGIFDTVLMLGQNFGLLQSHEGARRLLRRLARITSDRGRIITDTNDIYATTLPEHLAYQRMNIDRGRMAGQVRIRVRYKKYTTPWFDYLQVSKVEMEEILGPTDWSVERFLDSGPVYVAILKKRPKL